MYINDDDLIAVTCWRCSSPLLGYLWSEPAVAVVCPCGGHTRIPAQALETTEEKEGDTT